MKTLETLKDGDVITIYDWNNIQKEMGGLYSTETAIHKYHLDIIIKKVWNSLTLGDYIKNPKNISFRVIKFDRSSKIKRKRIVILLN